MIVTFHLESNSPAVSNIDHPGVFFSSLDQDFRSGGGKFFEFEARVLVGTMFAPHDRENAQLSEIRFPAQDHFDSFVLFLCYAVATD